MTTRSSNAIHSPTASHHAVAGRTGAVASVDINTMMPAFERFVADAVVQVAACPAKPDATFHGYESLLAAIRSATTLEGALLEKGIALVAAANPDLTLVRLERALPVHDAAKAVFRRNDWSKASGLRLDSDVATREFYKPDLLLVDSGRQLALIIDVKRSVASYKARTLAELRSRMMASALVVRDVLERDHDVPPVARADIAIIDGAGDCKDEAQGIFALNDLDWMLRIKGACAAITCLRDLYGQSVRSLLAQRCAAIVVPRQSQQHLQDRESERSALQEAVNAQEEVGSLDGEKEADHGMSHGPDGSAVSMSARFYPRVAVGIASRRSH